MPITIVLLLASAPILTLSMMFGDWSPETLISAKLILAASVVTLLLWIVVDATRTLTDKWRRFVSRPY